jgi:hypothetical protein
MVEADAGLSCIPSELNLQKAALFGRDSHKATKVVIPAHESVRQQGVFSRCSSSLSSMKSRTSYIVKIHERLYSSCSCGKSLVCIYK